jgi:hypothetical protein
MMADRPLEPRLHFDEELSSPLARAAEAFAADLPLESSVSEAIDRLTRVAPVTAALAAADRVTAHAPLKRGTLAAACMGLTLLLLWSGSLTQAGVRFAEKTRYLAYAERGGAMHDGVTAAPSAASRSLRFLLLAHVGTLLAGYAAWCVAWVAAQVGVVVGRRSGGESVLHRISRRALVFGLGCYALGVLLGAAWAWIEWGELWRWDPREAFALFTLLLAGTWYFWRSRTTAEMAANPAAAQWRWALISCVYFWAIALAYWLGPRYAALHAYSFGFGSNAIPNAIFLAGLANAVLLGLAGLRRGQQLSAP